MKNQDNITQLYQDAFSDFEVQAPAEVYAKVQNQLGRKSLLTLDPTRLNIFYLALMSGIVAWALLGKSGDSPLANDADKIETASKLLTVQDQKPAETTFLSNVSKEEAAEEHQTVNEDIAIVTQKTRTQIAESNTSSNNMVSTNLGLSDDVQTANELENGLETADKNQEDLTTVADLKSSEKIDAEKSNSTKTEEISKQDLAVEEELKRNTAPTSVNGSAPESAKAFLDGLKLDRDNQKDLKVKKK